MGRSTGSFVARRAIAAGLLVFVLAGCGGHSYVQVGSSGSPSTGVSTGGSVSVHGYSTLGTLLALAVLASASWQADHAAPPFSRAVPPLDPSRLVAERDCTQPIEDWSANLKCR
jgi:hypothetical protein